MSRPAEIDLPAVLGGTPMFPEGVPLARPTVLDPTAVGRDVERILASGVLTNGPMVRELERRAAEYLGVGHCIAVASCTTGLMLVLRAADLAGDVVVPSFTFAATAHAVAWNGLRPVFADVHRTTLTLDPASASNALGVRTSAILATHVYGTPCDVDGLQELARRNGVRLFFDAAHAFGSRYRGTNVGGFGDAEVFSLSPTKVLVAAEGGIIATNDDVLAERCRIGRDYGNPGDYDCLFVGLNARMSELHAVVALDSLARIEERIEQRNRLASRYRRVFADLPGIAFPSVAAGDRSTFKDLTALVDPEGFGLDADALAVALSAEGVETRRYYAPPVHRMRAYAGSNGTVPLTSTNDASSRVITLPLWDGMPENHVDRLGDAIDRIRRHAGTEVNGAGVRNLRSSAHRPRRDLSYPEDLTKEGFDA